MLESKFIYNISYYLKTINPKGRIAWEYNPLHNLRRTKNTDSNGLHYDLVKLYGLLYTFILKKLNNTDGTLWFYKGINGDTLVILKHGDGITKVSLNGEEVDKSKLIIYTENKDNIEAGSIVDFDTELLNFSLNNPVLIDVLPSYDGSVNLILNDLRNPPRMINSRFSTRELNTYEIIDRIGDNDTNIYDDDINLFDLDTSLYKKYNKIPKVQFNGVITGGNLKVGNYVLYFRYCDADENETDFVTESGIISVFKGNDKDPFSIDGGFVDMNAHKSIDVTLTNIDEAYDYIKVYYTRSSSDFDLNRQTTAVKLIKKFVVSRNRCNIIITGDEQVELISQEELVSEYFIAESVKTQTLCLNMLFLGNVSRPDPLHQDLTDISIRILPYLLKDNANSIIGYVSPENYLDVENIYNNYEYYNTKNIYYNLGYWNEEMYRLGVVYVMYDNTLSKVYNIRGCDSLPTYDELSTGYYTPSGDIFDEQGNRQYIKISEEDFSIVGGKYLENSRGVVRFADFGTPSQGTDYIYSIGIVIPEEVITYLKNYCGIKGMFFVRQKRIPTIMAQGLTLPIDPEARVPLIYQDYQNEESFRNESFISQEKIKIQSADLFHHSKYIEKELIHDYKKRLIEPKEAEVTKIKNAKAAVIICPDYEIRQQYYNQFFTGTEYPISYASILYGDIRASKSNERFYVQSGQKTNSQESVMTWAKLVSVTEDVPTVAIGEEIFKGVCGTAQEGFRYSFAFKDGLRTKEDSNLIRGIWHPYVGAVFQNKVNYGKLINIYIPGYNISQLANYYMVRYSDNSPYYPIGDRLGIDDLSTFEFDSNTGYKLNFFRGDCYICTFTHRLNRNFQDPAAPANDIIIDKDSWKEFDPEDKETFDKINLGDINAIKLGSWYTFKIRSNTNLSIRSLDESHLEEKGLFGLPRGFYPLQQELTSGNNKIPDSYNINDGFRSNFGEKFYLRYPDVPYIKNNFENRILYSLIAINDAFRNGYRVFKSTHFNDYTKEYGSIVKLVTMSSQGMLNGLLCVFEHGVGYIPVNERAVAGEGAGGNVFINTSSVLPDNPRILSDLFGSQWQESIILTPYFVYGVDTVGKKIWRTNGAQLEVLSDFKLNKFLVENITLTEKEKTPIIGIRNVKTHYNANKNDVMFTFYDSLYGLEEKVWNLCYNEITQKFTTFYSWVPSYSENIDNIYFSFDREVSKAVSKLGTSQVGSTNSDGIILSKVVLPSNNLSTDIVGLNNRILPSVGNFNITYSIEEDPYGSHKFFNLTSNGEKYTLSFTGGDTLFNSRKVWYVFLKASIQVNRQDIDYYDKNNIASWDDPTFSYCYGYYSSIVAVTSEDVFNNQIEYKLDENGNQMRRFYNNEECETLTSDFWKHGQAGIIDIKDDIQPCQWYGKQHPFEFEFVVRDTPNMHKVFDNLEIISNKAEPESFHFEVIGEVYGFDKKNMYWRLEATKLLWQSNGVNVTFDRNYTKLTPELLSKSTIFPLYYNRIDKYDCIYDAYTQMNGNNKDYRNLSGSEVVWDKQMSEFRIVTHIKNSPISKDGRLRGNSHYKEDRWRILIPSITYMLKNEVWNNSKPPIVINYIPEDYIGDSIQIPDYLPNIYNNVETNNWTYRKETKIRDKYMKVRIRYEGSQLAVIQAVLTTYTESYA